MPGLNKNKKLKIWKPGKGLMYFADEIEERKEYFEKAYKDRIVMIDISKIEPADKSVEDKYDSGLDDLTDLIKMYGIIEPLLVKNKGAYYEIVLGVRRWRAAKIAGLKEIPSIIME